MTQPESTIMIHQVCPAICTIFYSLLYTENTLLKLSALFLQFYSLLFLSFYVHQNRRGGKLPSVVNPPPCHLLIFAGRLEYRVTEESLMDRLTTDTRGACQSIPKSCRSGIDIDYN